MRFPFRPVGPHLFGLDDSGRDVLARIFYGLRISLNFGLLLVVTSMVIGTIIGAVQGYYGGKFDLTGQRLTEIWEALPFLYVLILLGSVYGSSFILLLIVYGLFNWIGISYYMRAEFLRLRNQQFVEAAQCLGLPDRKILFRHILPNALVPLTTFFPFPWSAPSARWRRLITWVSACRHPPPVGDSYWRKRRDRPTGG